MQKNKWYIAFYVPRKNHPGNDIYYYNNSSFNLMNRFEYISDKYAGINVSIT